MAEKKWFDSHVHLDWFKIEEVPRVLQDADKVDVDSIVTVGRSVISSAANVWIAQRFRPIYAGIAIHPLWSDPLDDEAYMELKSLARDSNVVCIGETGIGVGSGGQPLTEIQVSPENRKEQREKFARHIRLARETGLPLSIHNDRASGADIAEVYEKEKGMEAGGMLHSNMMDLQDTRRLWEMGIYVSIGPHINREPFAFLEEVVREVPEELLIIETDTAGPGPNGDNGPHKLLEIAPKVAALRNISMDQLRDITVRNTKKLFHM